MQEHHIPGLIVRGHELTRPLDPTGRRSDSVQVFAREVVAAERESDALPWLVFLQGGPGFAAPRPVARAGWLGRAVQDYRVLLLDSRGTGRSDPLHGEALGSRSVDEQVDLLRCFRADAIVQDCEAFRRALAGERTKWSVLGQSFGGFCATHYLSVAPESLREVFITGGLPPLDGSAEDVYRRTYPTLERKNREYFARYPDDVERLRKVVQRLQAGDVVLPGGDPLSVRKLRLLGLHLGMSDGFEALHYLLEEPFVQGNPSPTFIRGLQALIHYDTNPLFSVLHEPCYAQETSTRWAARRVLDDYPHFREVPEDGPIPWTGEMIYPWMFEEFGALKPLAHAAQRLAEKEDWPRLYHPEVLRTNDVPVAAAVYANDLYVDRDASLKTAEVIRGARVWLTSEYEHNGLRAHGAAVLGRLIDMARGLA